MTKFCFFIPTFITVDKTLEILITNILSIKKIISDSYDIYIINNSVDKELIIIETLKKNHIENITIINSNIINAELGIFKFFKHVKDSYQYYINIHDSCYIKNILPNLKYNLYYFWKTNFILNYEASSGKTHLFEIINVMKKYNLTNNNLYNKLINLNDNEHFNVSHFFTFGCMFIANYEILNKVYNKIKYILKYNITKQERMAFETIIGYFLYEANNNQIIHSIESKTWGTIPCINNIFNYDYFTKGTFAR